MKIFSTFFIFLECAIWYQVSSCVDVLTWLLEVNLQICCVMRINLKWNCRKFTYEVSLQIHLWRKRLILFFFQVVTDCDINSLLLLLLLSSLTHSSPNEFYQENCISQQVPKSNLESITHSDHKIEVYLQQVIVDVEKSTSLIFQFFPIYTGAAGW